MGRLLTFGETMASLRAAGPLQLGGDLRLSIAGAEANVAIGVARQGHGAGWVGVTGDDELGRLVLRTLRGEGVDVTWCRVEPAARTGLMLVEPKLALVSRVSYYRAGSAGSTLTADDVGAAVAGLDPTVVHLTGITPALGPAPLDAARRTVEQARAAGVTVCFDVNFRSALWSRAEAREVLAPLAGSATIVVASEDELPLASGLADTAGHPAHVDALLESGVSEVVTTRGALGASAATPGRTYRCDAVPVTAIDTVGAGDAFVAGYLAGLLDGEETSARLRRAVATAAFCVSTRGDWEGLPGRRDLALVDQDLGTTLR